MGHEFAIVIIIIDMGNYCCFIRHKSKPLIIVMELDLSEGSSCNSEESKSPPGESLAATFNYLAQHPHGGSKQVYDLLEQVFRGSAKQQGDAALLKAFGRDLIDKFLSSTTEESVSLSV